MGRTHCRYVEDRLYNYKNTGKQDPKMNSTIANQLKKLCPPRTKKGQADPLVFLNPESGSRYIFNNSYYSRIGTHEAVLEVDQQLLYGDTLTTGLVSELASDFEELRFAFALSMSRMGSINVLTGKEGEIRRNCSCTNANNPNKK